MNELKNSNSSRPNSLRATPNGNARQGSNIISINNDGVSTGKNDFTYSEDVQSINYESDQANTDNHRGNASRQCRIGIKSIKVHSRRSFGVEESPGRKRMKLVPAQISVSKLKQNLNRVANHS